MKKCPSCGRTYSDLVEQCPTCGVNLHGASGSQPDTYSQENGNQQTHIYEAETTKSGKKGNATIWKVLTAVSLIFALIFLVLFVQRNSEYDDLKWRYNREIRAYNELSQDYEDLENIFSLYNLDGKYAIELSDVYNGDSDRNKISDRLDADTLEYICMSWVVHSFSEKWEDVIDIDVIRPDGSVVTPQAYYQNHTTRDFLQDVEGARSGRECRWSDQNWQTGTYRMVFYQNNTVIASLDIEVS